MNSLGELISLITTTLAKPIAGPLTKRITSSDQPSSFSNMCAGLARSQTTFSNSLHNRLRKSRGLDPVEFPELTDLQARTVGIRLAVENSLYLALLGYGYYQAKLYLAELRRKDEAQRAAQAKFERDLKQVQKNVKEMGELNQVIKVIGVAKRWIAWPFS